MPCSHAEDLAKEIARQWPVEGCGTALDLAIVEGLASPEDSKHLWDAPGPEFLPWCSASSHDWLGAAFRSFWWD